MQDAASFSALKYRDFRIFWVGHWVSCSGTWMHMTAQGWLVYELTKSPLYLGMVSAASTLPILLFSLVGGVVADRIEKRNLLILTQALSVFPVLMIGLLTTAGTITVWHVMGLVFILGTINAFDIPARQSFLVNMVERKSLLNAIALNSAAFNGARMVGPTLAGIIISTLGVAACFYINAASYLAVVIALTMLKARSSTSGQKADVLKDMAEGLRFMRGEPEVAAPIMLVAVFSLFGLPFVSQLPVFAEEVYASGARGLGFLIGASGIGAFMAALLLALKGDITHKHTATALTSIIFPALLIAFSLTRNMPLALGLMVCTGLAVVVLLATANSSIQLSSPDGLRGRVMSVYTFVFLGMTPIGHSMLGVMSHQMGSAAAVRTGAIICLVLSALILLVRKR